MRRRSIALWSTLFAALLVGVVPAQDAVPPLTLERAIHRAFEDGAYARAVGLIESYLELRPNDPQMLYNLACAHGRLDAVDAATSALFRAVKAGFADFEHMRTDPDLESIRGEEMYLAILEAARRTAGRRAEQALARWKTAYGERGYRYEIDEERRLAFATALDEVSHRDMRRMLERQTDHLIETLFDEPPEYYVLIAVPTPAHAEELFAGDPNIGGRYEHGQHRLIARDIGGSLRHEFVHAMHYGQMERLGLREPHPLWIQEGLAALYEDYEVRDGRIAFLPNERNNVVKRRAASNRLTPWRELFTMSADRFMARPGQLYPQVRSIFEFLADQDRLGAWYRAYLEHYDEDTSGARAFEVVFEQPADEVERRWRNWVRRRPMVDHQIGYGDASLGITSGVNDGNDGVTIAQVLRDSAAHRAGLRRGDVIVAIDDGSVRSIVELQRIIGSKRVGDHVTVRVRRRDRYLTREVVLRALE